MGKAVNMMMSGKSGGVKNNESPAFSTGKGGLQNTLKVKAAGIKSGSPTNAGLSPDGQRKLAPGEKTNALF